MQSLEVTYIQNIERLGIIYSTDCDVYPLSASLLPQFVLISTSHDSTNNISSVNLSNHLIYSIEQDNEVMHQKIQDLSTLEELIRKRSKEAKMSEVENKKNSVRQIVNNLRTEFMSIRQLNLSLPISSRLSQNELHLNSCFNEMYEGMLEREITNATAEFNTEESRSMKSIRSMFEEIFVDTVEDELFIVSALKSGYKVQSFPMLKLGDSFSKLKQLYHEDSKHSDTNLSEIDGPSIQNDDAIELSDQEGSVGSREKAVNRKVRV